ncbi:hypothetical protein [Yersinia intermedia]|uniref:hypothetical protein n=1 Tax=Yersinia intermedia TaxID=631 RepID=UPI0005E2B247|nr:hypothetical protein [Yersinia intermedia]CNH94783.1 Uncharacterised protein [Yersinia intermedia]
MTKKNMSGIYAWQRGRVENSALLVESAIGELLAGKQRISLAAIVQASKNVDPAEKGVSASTILRNQRCHAIYKKHSAPKASNQKSRSALSEALDEPTESELRRAYLLASKSKKILIAAVLSLERELKSCEAQNSNLREKILSLLLPDLVSRSG